MVGAVVDGEPVPEGPDDRTLPCGRCCAASPPTPNEYPWQWGPGDVAEYSAALRSRHPPRAVPTVRGYQIELPPAARRLVDQAPGRPGLSSAPHGPGPGGLTCEWTGRRRTPDCEAPAAGRAGSAPIASGLQETHHPDAGQSTVRLLHGTGAGKRPPGLGARQSSVSCGSGTGCRGFPNRPRRGHRHHQSGVASRGPRSIPFPPDSPAPSENLWHT